PANAAAAATRAERSGRGGTRPTTACGSRSRSAATGACATALSASTRAATHRATATDTVAAMTTIKLYGIPNCDTLKRARTWLAEHGREVEFHDFKKAGVPPDRLAAWVASAGWETVLNRKGNTWRGLDDAAKAAVADTGSAQALMRAQPSVIKRPVVEWP